MSQIEGYENYTINEDGKVINTNNGREKKPHLNKKTNYYQHILSKDGKIKQFLLHRLLAKAYIPNPENLPTIDHINRDTTDNRIENLRWATRHTQGKNRKCFSNTGFQFIHKRIDKTYTQGFSYMFSMYNPKICKTNGDLNKILEIRNKFCLENNIEINDIL
tara:strand:+ start:105 stop:590 length:486 start_codon:yes stop_codon:yes gene_type:complete